MTAQPTRFVAYCRVSTQKQGASGLGLESQQAAIAAHVHRSGGELVGELVEVETGKGSNALNRRPKLVEALALAKSQKATLVIAKLDRLARNVHFISGLMEAGVPFVALDMPEASKLTLHVMAAFAEHEREAISKRTKEALAAAKVRGTVMGAKVRENSAVVNSARQEGAQVLAENLRDDLAGLAGLSLRAAAQALAMKGHVTARGKPLSATQVLRLRERLGLVEAQAA
jgi:DNA invertase Pin-like site-specific DNA recombinase